MLLALTAGTRTGSEVYFEGRPRIHVEQALAKFLMRGEVIECSKPPTCRRGLPADPPASDRSGAYPCRSHRNTAIRQLLLANPPTYTWPRLGNGRDRACSIVFLSALGSRVGARELLVAAFVTVT